MKKQKTGYIRNVSSIAGKMGIGHLGGYSASKFGLMGLNELVASGIKVTAVCLGYVDTDRAASSKLAEEDKIPVADIVKMVQFLLGLSSNCCILEINSECCKTVELTNAALLTGR